MSYVEKVQLKLQMEDSVIDGKQKFKTKTYSNIRKEATEENLLIASNVLGSLSSKPLVTARKVETTVLEQPQV